MHLFALHTSRVVDGQDVRASYASTDRDVALEEGRRQAADPRLPGLTFDVTELQEMPA